MASGRVIHREKFQNANQMVEVLIRTKPKLPYSSAPMPNPEKFKRDCLIQKELDRISEEKGSEKHNVQQKERISKDKHLKSAKKRNSNMVVEVSKRNGYSRKKGHNNNHLDHTWRDLLKEYSSINGDETALSEANGDAVDHIPSRGPSEKMSKHDRAIQTSRSVRDGEIVLNRHNESQSRVEIMPEIRSSTSGLRDNNAGTSHAGLPDEPTAKHVHDHHVQAGCSTDRPANIVASAANRAGAGDRLSSDGLSSTPFSDSALQLLQQLRHKLQHRGDSESSEVLGVLEQYFVGAAAGGNKPPTPQSVQSPFTTVFDTPQANTGAHLQTNADAASPQYIHQLLLERAEQQRLNAQQAATIAELRHLSSRLLAQHAKDGAKPGSNPTSESATAGPLPLNGVGSRLAPGAPSTALSPLMEVSNESSGHQAFVHAPAVEDRTYDPEPSGPRYQMYPHEGVRGRPNDDDRQENSNIRHAARIQPPQIRGSTIGPGDVQATGAQQPVSNNRVAETQPPHTEVDRPFVGPAGGQGAVMRRPTSGVERASRTPRPGNEAGLSIQADGNLVEELRAEIWSLRCEMELLRRQKTSTAPLRVSGGGGNGSLVTQQPLASTARSTAAPLTLPANSSTSLNSQAKGTARAPPELSSVRNSLTQGGLRVTSTLPTLPSTQDQVKKSLERQGASTDVNSDLFRSDNVQQITTVDPALLEASTVGRASRNAAKDPRTQVESKTSSERSVDSKPSVLRSDSSRYAERQILCFGKENRIPRGTNPVVREEDLTCNTVSDLSEDEPKNLTDASRPSRNGFPASLGASHPSTEDFHTSTGDSENLDNCAPRVVRNGYGVHGTQSPDFGGSTSSISGCLLVDNSEASRDIDGPINRRLESTRMRESDESGLGVATSNSDSLPKVNALRGRVNMEVIRPNVSSARSLVSRATVGANIDNSTTFTNANIDNCRIPFVNISESQHFEPLVPEVDSSENSA